MCPAASLLVDMYLCKHVFFFSFYFNRLEYEKRKNLEEPLRKLEQKKEEDTNSLKDLKKQIKKLQDKEGTLQGQLKALMEQKEVTTTVAID